LCGWGVSTAASLAAHDIFFSFSLYSLFFLGALRGQQKNGLAFVETLTQKFNTPSLASLFHNEWAQRSSLRACAGPL
jgi:hypothetical protein